jgi:hypothetical protein
MINPRPDPKRFFSLAARNPKNPSANFSSPDEEERRRVYYNEL